MMRHLSCSVFVLSMISSTILMPIMASAADCQARITKLRQHIAEGRQASDLQRSVFEVADAPECGPDDSMLAKRMVAERLLSLAGEARSARNSDLADRLIINAAELHAHWRAAFEYGNIHSRKGDYAKAAQAYQDALNMLSADGQASAVGTKTLQQLTLKADEAFHLAAAGKQSGDIQGVLVRSVTRNGEPGGVLNAIANRGIESMRLPMPILFQFDSDVFTKVGEEAARELRDILKAAQPREVIIVGHTDRKGADGYNQTLSERRASRVAQYLKANGISTNIQIVGKGKRSPRALSEGHSYTQDEIDELNRRVEFDWK